MEKRRKARLVAVAKELKLEHEMKRHWRIQKRKTQTRNGLERERESTLMGFVDGSLSSRVCM